MPFVTLTVRKPKSVEFKSAVLDAVHGALVAAFRIPPEDKHVRLLVHEPHRFLCSSTLAEPDLATLVTVDCFAGRSLDAKRSLYDLVVDGLATLGIPRDHVMITLREHPRENWGIRGGRAGCDVELGFAVDV